MFRARVLITEIDNAKFTRVTADGKVELIAQCEGGPNGAGYYVDGAGNNFPVTYNGANFAANKSKGLLIVHMHNQTGVRSDIVVLQKPTISDFNPRSGKVGSNVVITGTNFGTGTKVFFSSNKQATPVTVLSDTSIQVKVPAGPR